MYVGTHLTEAPRGLGHGRLCNRNRKQSDCHQAHVTGWPNCVNETWCGCIFAALVTETGGWMGCRTSRSRDEVGMESSGWVSYIHVWPKRSQHGTGDGYRYSLPESSARY